MSGFKFDPDDIEAAGRRIAKDQADIVDKLYDVAPLLESSGGVAGSDPAAGFFGPLYDRVAARALNGARVGTMAVDKAARAILWQADLYRRTERRNTEIIRRAPLPGMLDPLGLAGLRPPHIPPDGDTGSGTDLPLRDPPTITVPTVGGWASWPAGGGPTGYEAALYNLAAPWWQLSQRIQHASRSMGSAVQDLRERNKSDSIKLMPGVVERIAGDPGRGTLGTVGDACFQLGRVCIGYADAIHQAREDIDARLRDGSLDEATLDAIRLTLVRTTQSAVDPIRWLADHLDGIIAATPGIEPPPPAGDGATPAPPDFGPVINVPAPPHLGDRGFTPARIGPERLPTPQALDLGPDKGMTPADTDDKPLINVPAADLPGIAKVLSQLPPEFRPGR